MDGGMLARRSRDTFRKSTWVCDVDITEETG